MSSFYSSGLKAFLDGDIDLLVDDIRVILVDNADYTFSAAHDWLSDVPSAGRIDTAVLAGKDTTDGIFDANDITFTSVTGDEFESLVIYKHTGTPSTSQLIAYIDTGTGFPLTPDGGNIDLTWDNGANKIFKIG